MKLVHPYAHVDHKSSRGCCGPISSDLGYASCLQIRQDEAPNSVHVYSPTVSCLQLVDAKAVRVTLAFVDGIKTLSTVSCTVMFVKGAAGHYVHVPRSDPGKMPKPMKAKQLGTLLGCCWLRQFMWVCSVVAVHGAVVDGVGGDQAVAGLPLPWQPRGHHGTGRRPQGPIQRLPRCCC